MHAQTARQRNNWYCYSVWCVPGTTSHVISSIGLVICEIASFLLLKILRKQKRFCIVTPMAACKVLIILSLSHCVLDFAHISIIGDHAIGEYHLKLGNVTLHDDGIYKCYVPASGNYSAITSTSAHLTVASKYNTSFSEARNMQNIPGIWLKFSSKMWIFYKFSENVLRKRQKYPSKWYIFPQNCKDFPPKAQFPGKEIPQFHDDGI